MKGEETKLKGCWVIEPDVFEDERGFFYEGFNSAKFEAITGEKFEVKQLNQSRSIKGVLRGLHFQRSPRSQAKLITCTDGEVLDVAVDLRENSPTYAQYFMIRLSSDNKKHLFMPKGFAHGFLVLSEFATLMYQVDELYSRAHDTGIIYNDPQIAVSWGVPEEELVLSERDKQHPTLEDLNMTLQ